MDDERCRITVVGMRRRVDLAVPARAPIAEYVPNLSRLCGQETDETLPASWSLALAGARPFPPSMSLLEAQVVDGATLYLRDVVEGETDGPLVTDIEEIVEEAAGQWDRWNGRHRAMTVIGVGLGGFLAALAVLVFQAPTGPLTGLVAIVAGFGFALLAGLATRRGWAIPVPLRVALALSACPALALAGYTLPGAGDGAGAAIAITAGAAVGALAAALALPHEATLAVGLLAAVALPVAILIAAVGADLVESAAAVGVVALLMLSSAAAAAGRLVTLVPARANPGASPDPVAETAETMRRGRRVMIAFALVSSLVSVASLLVLTASDDPFAIMLALCLSLALLTQAGQSVVPVAVMPGIAAGAAGLVALAIQAPVHLLHATAPAPALIVCGLAAVVLAVGLTLATQPAKTLDERPSWLATTGLLLTVSSAPLAVGVFGVFQYLADVGGRL
ncbi:EsaB/YukD family protein [Actinoallomurus purpureus]|uniref:EsaB/YukD family protein n=1 Tax=Actinoallomurus purpureus TaxID=478114 RepID=UPI0020924F76|nr:EsaB/YukD family protein [Actinoallomurus purpureus]MCO6004196.1 EsaB/YukD family protein [Actinoallomurus purpureus]